MRFKIYDLSYLLYKKYQCNFDVRRRQSVTIDQHKIIIGLNRNYGSQAMIYRFALRKLTIFQSYRTMTNIVRELEFLLRYNTTYVNKWMIPACRL